MSFADESAGSFNRVYDESQESAGAGEYRKYLLEYLTEYYLIIEKHQGNNKQFLGKNRSHVNQPDMGGFTLQHRKIDDRTGEGVTAEITDVSVEINQKMIAGGEPSKQ